MTGLNGPEGLALSGNGLFVAETGPFPPAAGIGTVGEYNATTGTAINANFITGLNVPLELAISAAAPPTVPEPSTWSIVALGGVTVFGLMLWRNRHLYAERTRRDAPHLEATCIGT